MKKFVTVIMLLALFVSLVPGKVGAAVVPKLYLNGKQLKPPQSRKSSVNRLLCRYERLRKVLVLMSCGHPRM